MMQTPANKTVRLNNGVEMPILGLGAWQMSEGEETEQAVKWALEAGYRHIDTATLYGNETSVGKAIQEYTGESGIAREEIFVTTKLLPTNFFDPEKAFHKSLERLGFAYVDLYLVHWPIPLMPKSVWLSLEKIYDDKLARAIGISNYGIGDIEKLLKCCRANGIALEAYSPLTRGSHLRDPAIRSIAEKYQKSPAQIMIRWCVEHEVIVIPKSSNSDRIKENADVFDFELGQEDMQILDALS